MYALHFGSRGGLFRRVSILFLRARSAIWNSGLSIFQIEHLISFNLLLTDAGMFAGRKVGLGRGNPGK
mgnify:CR=1 FL=1